MSPSLDFQTVMAASIHDIKNSLTHVRNMMSQLAKNSDFSGFPEFKALNLETEKMNSTLVQLLVLYRINTTGYQPLIDEFPVKDIFHDVAAHYADLLKSAGIKLSIDCDDDLMCYCDFDLATQVLTSILNNAQRYCCQKIRLAASQSERYVCLSVEDDGGGFSNSSLSSSQNFRISNSHNNTGLGLYFAETIAQSHHQGKLTGYTEIDNLSSLGGARFRLFLP